jgi:hypothetical protein
MRSVGCVHPEECREVREAPPFVYDGATIEVVADREGEPPHISRMHYDLVLDTEETLHRIELLQKNIEKFGTISNTLARACDVTGTIRRR